MTTSIQNVRVDLADRSYDIQIGTSNLGQAGTMVRQRIQASHAIAVTDENVRQPHAEKVAESLADADIDVDLMVIEPGEQAKSIEMANSLWQGMLELGASRTSVVVAVGGGVVGDLAGFVASTFARGLRFFQVPTTLLSQVDSSVGGKVGINLPTAKNMVGAFLQPLGVLIDTDTLQTLPKREYRAGLGEVVKYGVILDAVLFEYIESHVDQLLNLEPEVVRHIVARCCRLKAEVVQQDELELSGLRAILNYGHTFAHAYEALCGYGELLHGEAVAVGMITASRLAERLGRIDPNLTARQRDLLEELGLAVEAPQLDPDRVIETMMHDKKVAHGRLRFVLPDRLGHVELVDDVDPDLVRDVLAT